MSAGDMVEQVSRGEGCGHHRLLAQPSGFQRGRSVLAEILQLDRLPVPKRPHVRDPRLDLGAARLPSRAGPDEREHLVAGIDQLLRLPRRKFTPRLTGFIEEGGEDLGVEIADDGRVDEPAREVDHEVGREEVQQMIVAARNQGVEAPDDLDVLLRHRLLPRPGGFERFLPLLIHANAGDGAIAQCPDQSDPSRCLVPVANANVSGLGNHYLLPGFDELVRLDPNRLPDTDELVQDLAHLIEQVYTVNWTDRPREVEFKVRSRIAKRGVNVSPVEGIDGGPNHLDVLLRHLPAVSREVDQVPAFHAGEQRPEPTRSLLLRPIRRSHSWDVAPLSDG